MAQSYLSQDEVSLFGMKLMDNARDHITYNELESKIVNTETAELFYDVWLESKKNANFSYIYITIDSNNIIHGIAGIEEIDAALYECKEKILPKFVSRFEQKYSTNMQSGETVNTSFINHIKTVFFPEGGSIRFQCQEYFSGNHNFWAILQTLEMVESINRFYDEGF